MDYEWERSLTSPRMMEKDNGRIASDVASYEKLNGILDEKLDTTQEIIRDFLKQKDEPNNVKLKN